MRGLEGYLSRSRFSSGTARPYSFRARSVAAFSVSSAMRATFYSVLDALQLQLCGRGRRRVGIALDGLVEGAARHGEIAGLLEGQPGLEERVGRLVRLAVLLRYPLVVLHGVGVVGGGKVGLADPVERVVGEVAGAVGVEHFL